MTTHLDLHLDPDDSTRAQLATIGAPSFEAFRIYVGSTTIVLFGTADQLLTFAANVEQAARIWQMERDGVSADNIQRVLAADPR